MISQKSRGFTIVELLIVVVVIGILAAIVIVAYNGVQTRARNSNTASVIQAYKKALLQYATDKQAYPTAGAVCLGEDYPDTGVFTTANSRNCFRSNSTVLINAAFNTAIRPYMNNAGVLPTPNNTVVGSGSSPWSLRGAIFHGSTGLTINGVTNPNPWVIIYSVEGATQCPVGPVLDLSDPAHPYPNITSTPPPSGYSLLVSGGTVGAECWLPMPDPAKL